MGALWGAAGGGGVVAKTPLSPDSLGLSFHGQQEELAQTQPIPFAILTAPICRERLEKASSGADKFQTARMAEQSA